MNAGNAANRCTPRGLAPFAIKGLAPFPPAKSRETVPVPFDANVQAVPPVYSFRRMAIDAHAVVAPAAMDASSDDPATRVAALFDAHHQRLFRLARRLVRVLINVCKDSWRHTAVRVKALAEGHVRGAAAANPESGLLAHAMVWRALDRLPPRRRAILVLYELEGVPVAEIATLIGITPVTVRWHLMRARQEMARVLDDRRPLPGDTHE